MIEAALETAEVDALRIALYQATGDLVLPTMRLARKLVRNRAAYVEVVNQEDEPRVTRLATEILPARRLWRPQPPPSGAEQPRLIEESR
jgi:hypothetical protein